MPFRFPNDICPPRGKKGRRSGFSSKLSKNRAKMTVRREDGATFCTGGRTEVFREFGEPVPTSSAFQPYVCKPRDPVCSEDKLPVPLEKKGLADCAVPLERRQDTQK